MCISYEFRVANFIDFEPLFVIELALTSLLTSSYYLV